MAYAYVGTMLANTSLYAYAYVNTCVPAFALYGYSYVYVSTMLASASVYEYSHAYIFQNDASGFQNQSKCTPTQFHWVGVHFD